MRTTSKVSIHREDPLGSRHLLEEVSMVGDRHELGERRPPQDGVVGSLELGDLKVDVLSAVVVLGAEGDRQADSAKRGRPGTGGAGEDDVQCIAPIDEYFGQADLADHWPR
jgi:hypothetical protein